MLSPRRPLLCSSFMGLIASIQVMVPALVPAEATTIVVGSGRFTTIQSGLDAAASGDSVLVGPGIWSGPGNRDLDFGGKAVVLLSTAGPEATIIDCGGSEAEPHRGIYFHSGEFLATVEGFTIRNGVVTGGFWDGTGAGIRITGNAIVQILNCHMIGNRAAGDAAGGGVGIDGGGVTQAIIAGCVLSGNSATVGGGLSCVGSLATLGDCVIAGNLGSGIFVDNAATMTVNGTTITRNQGDNVGGAIFSISGAFVQFNRVIIWGNCAPSINEIYVQSSGTFHFDYCDVDSLACFYGVQVVHSYEQTIAEDPLFCGPGSCLAVPSTSGDYSLVSGSPCLPATAGFLIGARGEGCAVLGLPGHASRFEPRLSIHPNPTRGRVKVEFQSGPRETVGLAVYDLAGRLVRQLGSGPWSGTFIWDGLDTGGRPVAPGVYFMRLEGNMASAVRQLVIVR